ncbi:hypothetical protein HW40_12175 [Mannheimia haemolytica]|uniref:hypothetical protein n=1 Tax=Mannheimia haemolytica TaxID=75985 RepID=UPI0005C8B1C4|nr:hypothetical protein [Mannheimia haemolytica]KIX27736.1 hypothetical protein HW40_12175 [Mannheimia haemolytica]UQX70849.1 hypothetical protein M3705_05180 [Mannheimia haemolytica]UQX80537.1 hypothetical protein M3703_04265 [Mannheimia haemolytica]
MGLDAWLFSLPRKVDNEVDFILCEDESPAEIGYWRKNWDIHQFLADIYFERGGLGEFNCNRLMLDEIDLDCLEEAIQESFEYDYEYPEDIEVERERDLNIVKKARAELAKGNTVYYDSWW